MRAVNEVGFDAVSCWSGCKVEGKCGIIDIGIRRWVGGDVI